MEEKKKTKNNCVVREHDVPRSPEQDSHVAESDRSNGDHGFINVFFI